ncbi:kinesin-like protein KIN-4A [Physcomitrium patens]|uniref:Kinesin motor domain-containing protein n=1 Tax=Physcomitrium patens TaxID=3218 RepID=A0A2K1KTW6_PHYPA|nr:kinesin-like protein KIN-4A isoform X1 [Physcomitrium patens]XP_024371094.1 kinesin-like protein KIN-4A isoform X1 [Physcomitrium patens]PNR57200.1 hypothetical protein PHYPA_004193 [Physcomitrium patens]|eukprot:XP_024371093.1 kinesin-like protein KIN-4A isoform X1 [Physcomitrella patens]
MCETMERTNSHDSGSSDGSGSLNTSMDKEATQAVQVALNVRPLITQERIQGCKDCILVVPGEPQVQIGSHSFTFDHVFGSTGTPLSTIFDRCVAPLVEGLFHGYNATVLAYGQTGSGKTYTMGTAYTVGGNSDGVIPKVMETIFNKVETLKDSAEFNLRISFIEILKEEVHDLLDFSPPSTELPTSNGTNGLAFGGGLKTGATVKPPIQIRETGNGGITLAGVTETEVTTLAEMAICLEQGSLCRATGSTNMNSSSSRSHAIFTITVEQKRKWDSPTACAGVLDDSSDDYLCAKLHLVDLAGSERAKRTGADGMRFKEGVHINKGLLALGNVISALGDDKKRKEGGHVPYRDSKLTRLLQDSLGGNSRTVMIACVSPADSNAEETLNTLKYANRARNIQNKPTVNRDPMAAEMQRMRHQLELMQAELICARGGGPSSADVQILKQKIAWLETSNLDYRKELEENRARLAQLSQQAVESQVSRDKLQLKLDQLRSGKTFQELDEEDSTATEDMLKDYVSKIQELETELHQYRCYPKGFKSPSAANLSDICSATEFADGVLPSANVPEVAEAEVQAKEWEHTVLQENLDKELKELDKKLEQKEAEMKSFSKPETVVLKQHFERKLVELEEEKKMLQRERDTLMTELESLATTSDEHTHKLQESYGNKLKTLESQIADLKKKQENQSHLLRAKQRIEESAKRLQEEIQRIKAHKVQLQQKQKQESEQFRVWKAQREKEVLQLRKEGRRNVFEMQKLQALHQRQTKVLQRKTEEAAAATKRLKDLLEARKSSKENCTNGAANVNGSGAQSEKALQNWLEQELEVAVRVHEVRTAYEKQMAERAAYAKELAELRQEEDKSSSDPDENPTSRSADKECVGSTRSCRITLLESMLTSSSSSLVAMASQLSEAEERERNFSGRARWAHLRSMGDAKNLLHLVFNAASLARCQIRDKEEEEKDTKEKIAELEEILRQSEIDRQDLEQQHRLKEQQFTAALAAATKVHSGFGAVKRRDVEKVSVLTKWRQSSDPSKDSSSGSEKSSYALRKGSRDARRNVSDTEWDSDVHLSDNDLSMEDSDSDWQDKYAIRRNNSSSGSGRSTHKGYMSRKMISNGAGLHPRGKEKNGAPIEGLSISKRNQPNFDSGEHTPIQASKSASVHFGSYVIDEEPITPERLCSSPSSSNEFQGSIPFSFEIAQLEQSPVGEGSDRRLSLVGILDEVEAGARRAERAMAAERAAMAAQAAALLDSAFQEATSPIVGRAQGGGHLGSGEESDGERARRRPLSDLGNIKMLSSQGKPKRKQRPTFNLVTQEPNLPAQADPPSPLPSSITSLISARASLMNATTPKKNNSNGTTTFSDRPRPVPLPLPPGIDALSTSSPSRRPPPHESVITASSPLRTTPAFEASSYTARSPLRSAPSFDPAITPSTPVRSAPTHESPFISRSPLRSTPSFEPAMTPSTPLRSAPTHETPFSAKSPLRAASSCEPLISEKSPLRAASSYEPLISEKSPLRMLPSYQRRITTPSASPMKLTQNGTGETDSRQHTLGASESRVSAFGATDSRTSKPDVESTRSSVLAGFESIRSKNGAFSSMDLMRSKNTVAGSTSSQSGSSRKKESVTASPAAKREKENIRSTLRR